MKKSTLIKVVTLVLALLMLAGCAAPAQQTEAKAADQTTAEAAGDTAAPQNILETVNIQINAINYVDPFQTDNGGHAKVYLLTHDRLVEKDLVNGGYIPGLAESWEWTSDNTMEYHIRQGVKFHNGEELKADDVVYSLERERTGNSASKLTAILGTEVVDDYTVKMTLDGYNADIEPILTETFCSICNRKACEEDEVNGPAIGTGPYMCTDFVPADHVYLTRFDDFWGEPVPTKNINIRHIGEDATAVIALQNGEMNLIETDTENQVFIEEDEGLEFYSDPCNTVCYMAFNSSKGVTADRNFRLAFAYGLDLEGLAQYECGDLYTLTAANWGPMTYGYCDTIEPYHRDVEKAKEYLAKAFPDGNASITIQVAGWADLAEVIQAQMKEVGLDMQIENMENAALTAMTKYNVAEHNMMLGTCGWNLYGDDCRRVYYPGSNVNKAIINNDRITELVDLAVAEKDDAKRKEYYAEIQQINHDECYFLPMFLGTNCYGLTKGTSGIKYASNGRNDYRYITVPAN